MKNGTNGTNGTAAKPKPNRLVQPRSALKHMQRMLETGALIEDAMPQAIEFARNCLADIGCDDRTKANAAKFLATVRAQQVSPAIHMDKQDRGIIGGDTQLTVVVVRA